MEYYSDYLAHSSRKGSQRKNHKYTARQWVNGRWKYIYGKAQAAGAKIADVAGVDERKEYLKRKKTSDRYEKDLEEHGYEPLLRDDGRNDTFRKYVNLNDPHDKAIKDWNAWQNNEARWKEQGHKLQSKSIEANDKTREAAYKYSKTPLGKIEMSTAVQAGQKALSKLFKKKN